ncbi:sensor domain-containing diguanylate cyclase [Thalassovita sp.]|uniref:GGDEF domain-containing protein n=1 Tax=Thalassovita sp. TaxID=1979401 RepID=UPI002B27865D|nr:diguanylate cyclase [Thalassovita sp.]
MPTTCDTALSELLDTLVPMHLQLDGEGRIIHVGPTLTKLRPGVDLIGESVFDLFDIQRPGNISTMAALMARLRAKLHLRFRQDPCTALKGVLSRFGDTLVLNLSFGISVQDGIRDYALTASDFAPTDMTVEMLYLFEAKSAAMDASRRLNARLQGAKIAAEEQAYTDTLTGLKNRRAMDHVLARLIANRAAFALLHLDLDFFKQVNDTMGHAAGDQVLQQVAGIMVELTRQQDTVVRYGGDEFVLILAGPTDKHVLQSVAERLIARLEQPIHIDGKSCAVSASIGIVRSVDYDRPEPERMLSDADAALYVSKRNGRSQLHFHGAD